MCDPRIQLKDGIVPLEEDEHERDASPLPSFEAPDGECSHLTLGHPIIMVLVSRGLQDQEDCLGVLNILLLLGGD